MLLSVFWRLSEQCQSWPFGLKAAGSPPKCASSSSTWWKLSFSRITAPRGPGSNSGNPQFTHISIDDFRVVHANLTGGNRVTTGRQVPYCLFTDPELARIGLSETEAEAQGIAYRLFKVPMETNLRARTLSETRGFVKALVEADSDRILGFTAFGVGAGRSWPPSRLR